MKRNSGSKGYKKREERQNYQVLVIVVFLSDTWRKVSLGGDNLCDSGLQQGWWYSFSPSIGGAMPAMCPPIYSYIQASWNRFSTVVLKKSVPGWLKGSHPTALLNRPERDCLLSLE